MKQIILVFSLFLFSICSYAADLSGKTYWDGIAQSFTYIGEGAYYQFKEKNNIYYAAAAAPSLWFSFKEDKRLSSHLRAKKIPKVAQISSDLAPVFSFPIISIALFSYGIKKDDPRMVQFAKEYLATLYMALLECAAISAIRIHDRPSADNLADIETIFRGRSSFPSGHVVPYAALMFKTFQFYGPYWSIVPATLTYLTAVQRVREGKHYLSDIIGGFFLSAFASEGVRRAGNFNGNHPAYKFLFERNVSVGLIEHQGAIGPRLTFDWN